VAALYPASKQYGIAQYKVGYILKEQGKHTEAIAEFEKLLRSTVSARDLGGDIMDAYKNFRHSAALQISECYEALGQPRKAYDYALLARDKYPYLTWCGTCAQSSAKEMQERINRLAKSAGILP
jgi:tetratricopeptide (TPR) repeat protein